MKSLDTIHSILDERIKKAIEEGETGEIHLKAPYYELAEDMGIDGDLKADVFDIVVSINIRFADDEDVYETGTGFAIKNKISH